MNEIEFKSAFDAVRFALCYSSQQYGETPMAKRLRGESVGTGMGLVGLDGAGQAGIIRRELWELSDLQLAVVIAGAALPDMPCDCARACCSGRTPNPEWNAAITYLTDVSRSFCDGFSHYRVRRAIIEKVFGQKRSLEEVAKDCDAAVKTVSNHHASVRKWIDGNKKTEEVGIRVGIWAIVETRLDEIGLLSRKVESAT